MLDEEDSNHHSCTAAHDQDVKNPEMCIANRAPDPPPQNPNYYCICDHVYTFSTGVEEAGFDGMESFYSAESYLSDEPRNGRIKWDFHSTARDALSFRIPKFSRTASFIDYASDNVSH